MQLSIPTSTPLRLRREHLAGGAILAFSALLWGPAVWKLADAWRTDPSLSHGPLLLALMIGLLWAQRSRLREWTSAEWPGLLVLSGSALVHVAAMWADVGFMKPLSLLGMTAGAIWFLGGWTAFSAAVGPLGLFAFAIQWSANLIERVTFPLQLTSSAYAAMFAGILGLPIHREGVQLHVVPDPNEAPIYSILVAKQCSGLTSLMVLLALGYLIAYHTRIGLGWRALMVALIVPLTLFTNAVRLTFILLAGAYHSAGLAQWVHDHEAPFLIFLCSLLLLGIRALLLAWTQRVPTTITDNHIVEPIPASGC